MAFVSSSFTGLSVRPASTLAVSHRVAPVRAAPRRSTRMTLAPIASDVTLRVTEAAQLIAVKDGDFGGYTGPIIGLLIIGIIIAVLTPPIKE